MKKLLFFFVALFFINQITPDLMAQTDPTTPVATKNDTLLVVWSSGDPDVAEKVCFMYAYNAKKQGWFKEVIFVVWGPSAKLLSENESLQEYVKKMKDAGMILEACAACARMYGVGDDLKALGIDVKGMGTVLTDYLKKGYPNITF